MRELKLTVLALSTAMFAMWLLFYAYMDNLLKNYVFENMEQVSSQIISELNRSFLQLEEVPFVLSEAETVIAALISYTGSIVFCEGVVSEYS